MRLDDAGNDRGSTQLNELVAIVHEADTQARTIGLEGAYVYEALEAIAASATDDEDPAESMAIAVRRSIDEFKQLCNILDKALEEIETLQKRYKRLELFSHKWWQKHRLELKREFETDWEQGRRAWMTYYSDALIAWALDICHKLVQEPFPFPRSDDRLYELYESGTNALLEARYPDALSLLGKLTDDTARSILSARTRGLLEIFIGRIYLYQLDDPHTALKHFGRAQDIMPESGQPQAALASYYQHKGNPDHDSDHASSVADYAIELSPELPDGYVAMGIWSEGEKRWDEASAFYDEAITRVLDDKDPFVSLSRLLAPLSGNLCLRLAQQMFDRGQLKSALDAVDRALSIRIKGETKYPEVRGYVLKGQILEEEGELLQAAQAYCDAGDRYSWRGDNERASEVYKKAKGLKPDYMPTYWGYSESLRLLSFQAADDEEKKERLEQSLGLWEKGDQLLRRDPNTPFPGNQSWALVTRALLNESFYDLQSPEPEALSLHWWQALMFLERALLLRQFNAFQLTYMGRVYRYLDLRSNALKSIDTALKYDVNSTIAHEEKLINFVSMARFENAETLIGEWPSGSETVYEIWLPLVEGYIDFRQGLYEPALEKSTGEPGEWAKRQWYWVHQYRAKCYTLLNQPNKALSELNFIFEKYKSNSLSNLLTFSSAAFHIAVLDGKRTALLELAAELSGRAAKNPPWALEANTIVGFCYLARDETVHLAKSSLLDGINMSKNVGDLDQLVKREFKIVEQYAESWEHRAKVKKILESLKSVITHKQDELAQRTISPEAELVLELDSMKDTSGWSWWAAKAGQARLYADQKQWALTAAAYRYLLEQSELSTTPPAPFPEARIGLEKAVDELRAEAKVDLDQENALAATEKIEQALLYEQLLTRPETYAELKQELGYAYLKAGEPEEALKHFERALELDTVAKDMKIQAGLYGRLGFTRFLMADTEGARESCAQALRLFGEAHEPDPGEFLGGLCRSLLKDVPQYWALDGEWEKFAIDPRTDGRIRKEIAIARRSLGKYLVERFQLEASSSSVSNLPPSVTPLAVEMGDQLIPRDTESDWTLLKEHLPRMRGRLKEEMGVSVPAVRVRTGQEILAPNGYRILLNDTPVAAGTLMKGQVYCLEDPFTLAGRHNIPNSAITPADHPVTGASGSWVSKSNEEKLIQNRLTYWPDHELYMIYHIESVIRQNLAMFVGIQETATLLEQWRDENEETELIDELLANVATQSRFGRLLRTLLSEGVSIAPWREILQAAHESGLPHEDVSDAVRSTRLHIKEHLPGNFNQLQGIALCPLPESFEHAISERLSRQDVTQFLDAKPEETKELLVQLRQSVEPYGPDTVLIVRDASVRPFIRQLAKVEFPRVYAIAEEELLSR